MRNFEALHGMLQLTLGTSADSGSCVEREKLDDLTLGTEGSSEQVYPFYQSFQRNSKGPGTILRTCRAISNHGPNSNSSNNPNITITAEMHPS